MNLEEIKTAVHEGKTVCWSNPAYVVKNYDEQWLIECLLNGHAIGLTWLDGKTMNGEEKDFFIQN